VHNHHYNIYIASCETDGGIFRYRLNADGNVEFVDFVNAEKPLYMAIANHKLHVLLRNPFENKMSGLIVYDLLEDGRLGNPSEVIPTNGEEACHLTIDGKTVYCVNYTSGSVVKMPDSFVEHSGRGIDPTRQAKPHPHCVGITPDKKYVCVADLGLDSLCLYDKNMQLSSLVKVPAGHGVRHFVFSEDGRYLFTANELQSTVSVFSYDNGSLQIIDTKSCLPKGVEGKSTAAAIRCHKGYIYISNRGHDSISKMSFDGRELSYVSSFDCGGKTPRDFIFADNVLICTNQDSDTVTVFKENCSGEFVLQKEFKVKSPICCLAEVLDY